MAKGVSHKGFAKTAASIASKQHISKASASAILASAARKAGKSALKKNPRLKKVSGVVKSKKKK